MTIYGNYYIDIDAFIQKYCVNKNNTELQCNGKCKLSKQLNLDDNTNTTQSDTLVNTSESFVIVYFSDIILNISPILLTLIKRGVNCKILQIKSNLYFELIGPPPKF